MSITVQELARIFEVYKAPFTYEEYGQFIFDKENQMIVDIRGWGYLQRFSDAVQIQDNVGKLITDFLNNAHMAYLMDKNKKEDGTIQTEKEGGDIPKK
jgi:GTP-binding protein EngB required for normal cell division